MAVDQELWEQLMKLDDDQRRELAELLFLTIDDGDDLDDEERARLHAALERSSDDVEAGRTYDAKAVLERFRARDRAGESE